ncbi:MAG: hypothetical protein PHT02_15095 [Tissierellia bacterium]|nr:hypothetical protein [Tissierellia bacterium]
MDEKYIHVVRPACIPLDVYKIETYLVIRESESHYIIKNNNGEEVAVDKNHSNVFIDYEDAYKKKILLSSNNP